MPHRLQPIYMVLDTVIMSVVATVTAFNALLLSVPPADAAELQTLVMPLMGALFPTAAMIMLNPKPETRKIVIGRAGFALFFASVFPGLFIQICTMLNMFMGWVTLFTHPVVLWGSGGGLSVVLYALSRPFCEGLYKRSEAISNMALDAAEREMAGKLKVAVDEVMNSKIEKATVQAAVVAHEKAVEAIVPVATEMIKGVTETQKLDKGLPK